MKTSTEIPFKIKDCIAHKSEYVEWLCENKTEKQLEQFKRKIDSLLASAMQYSGTEHIKLINLWKDQIETAIRQYSNQEHLYIVLRKMGKNKKITSHERLIMDCNYDWFYRKLYGLTAEKMKIVKGK